MARPGEVADIVSQDQYDYFAKQAQSAMAKLDMHLRPVREGDGQIKMRNSPLDDRGQARNAERDKEGNITNPGGGKADAPPSAKQATQALVKFHNAGGNRASLPKSSNTKDAYKARQERNQMKNDQVVSKATRPRGTSTVERQRLRASGATPRKGRYVRNRQGGWEYATPTQRTLAAGVKYLSKTIDEEFHNQLDEALGL
jgi:hypothetical protein